MDMQLNLQYMPKDWLTWWTEATFRHSDVPYWTGTGGVTPPLGNTGAPASFVCNNGTPIGTDACANEGGVGLALPAQGTPGQRASGSIAVNTPSRRM